MIEIPLVLIAGLLGSSHCVGMCGPFALVIGSSAPSWTANLRRQLVYSAGRIFTYGTLGACAGFGGWHIGQTIPWLVNLPAWLAIAAGALLIHQGLLAAGWLPRRLPAGTNAPCLGGNLLASFLRMPGTANVFLAGMFTGMLPCGLVYGFLALAASTGNMLWGAAVMAIFGLGTVPAMALSGMGGSLMSLAARRRLLRVAAWCVVTAGVVSIGRGLGFIHLAGWFDAPGCPLCH